MAERIRRLAIATGALFVMLLAGPNSADALGHCVFSVHSCPADLTQFCQTYCEDGDPEDDYSAAVCISGSTVYCYGQT